MEHALTMCRTHSGDVFYVLDEIGDTGKRAWVLATVEARIQGSGFRERLAGAKRDDRVQVERVGFDALNTAFDKLDGAHFS